MNSRLSVNISKCFKYLSLPPVKIAGTNSKSYRSCYLFYFFTHVVCENNRALVRIPVLTIF